MSLGEIAKFGARHHRVWGDGMTMLSLVARLGPCLGETTLVYSFGCRGAQGRRKLCGTADATLSGTLNGEGYDEERCANGCFTGRRSATMRLRSGRCSRL